jgi:DNA-binding transcriptional ArsR family regulator/uncharacterized protein YndB with AHSA1/START domain
MTVDDALGALGDSTRRQIVGRLACGPASVGQLAASLPVGRPAVSMHLRVLREAGLVSASTAGTRRLYQLEPDALGALRDYLDWYWTQALETFKQHVATQGEAPMEQELKVSKSIVVEAPPARTFALFVDQEQWWPITTHHLAQPAGERAVLEPFVGGRWYEVSPDGSETDWGRVLAFEPPHRLLLSWQMSADWSYEPDPERGSEIEVTFHAEADNQTRLVYEHRHLERYADRAEQMRAALDRPGAAGAVLLAFQNGLLAKTPTSALAPRDRHGGRTNRRGGATVHGPRTRG